MEALSRQALRRILSYKLIEMPLEEGIFICDWLRGINRADLSAFHRNDRIHAVLSTLSTNEPIRRFFLSVKTAFEEYDKYSIPELTEMEEAILSSLFLSDTPGNNYKKYVVLAPMLVLIYHASEFSAMKHNSRSFLQMLRDALTHTVTPTAY